MVFLDYSFRPLYKSWAVGCSRGIVKNAGYERGLMISWDCNPIFFGVGNRIPIFHCMVMDYHFLKNKYCITIFDLLS